jgi:hypothetical protein
VGFKLHATVFARFGANKQQPRLCAVWKTEFRLPVTAVDDCNIVDVLFIGQLYKAGTEA